MAEIVFEMPLRVKRRKYGHKRWIGLNTLVSDVEVFKIYDTPAWDLFFNHDTPLPQHKEEVVLRIVREEQDGTSNHS